MLLPKRFSDAIKMACSDMDGLIESGLARFNPFVTGQDLYSPNCEVNLTGAVVLNNIEYVDLIKGSDIIPDIRKSDFPRLAALSALMFYDFDQIFLSWYGVKVRENVRPAYSVCGSDFTKVKAHLFEEYIPVIEQLQTAHQLN